MNLCQTDPFTAQWYFIWNYLNIRDHLQAILKVENCAWQILNTWAKNYICTLRTSYFTVEDEKESAVFDTTSFILNRLLTVLAAVACSGQYWPGSAVLLSQCQQSMMGKHAWWKSHRQKHHQTDRSIHKGKRRKYVSLQCAASVHC